MTNRIPALLALLALSAGCEELIGTSAENVERMCDQDVFVVDTTDPGSDPEAACRPDHECTLRAAINSVADCHETERRTIRLQEGATYVLPDAHIPASWLESSSDPINARLGDTALPIIFDKMRIEGRGATIEATSGDLLFIVAEGGDLELVDVTLAGRPVHNEGVLTLESFRYDRVDQPLLTNTGTAVLRDATFEGEDVESGNMVVNAEFATLTVDGATLADLNTVTFVDNAGFTTLIDVELDRVRGNDDAADRRPSGASALRNLETGTAVVTGMTARDTWNSPVIFTEGQLTLSESLFRGCEADPGVGGIDVLAGTAAITDTVFEDNIGSTTGALKCSRGTLVELEGVDMIGNSALTEHGTGGLSLNDDCAVTARNTRIEDNQPKDCFVSGTITDAGGNSDSDGTCF